MNKYFSFIHKWLGILGIILVLAANSLLENIHGQDSVQRTFYDSLWTYPVQLLLIIALVNIILGSAIVSSKASNGRAKHTIGLIGSLAVIYGSVTNFVHFFLVQEFEKYSPSALMLVFFGSILMVISQMKAPLKGLGSKGKKRFKKGAPEIGVVKWFNIAKGFGFIRRQNATEIFVHYRAIKEPDVRGLREGQRVMFTVEKSNKGLQAANVRFVVRS